MCYKGYKMKKESINKMTLSQKNRAIKNDSRKDFICIVCNSKFKDSKSRDRKFCSRKCLKQIGAGTFKKNCESWNKGTKGIMKSAMKGKKIPSRSGINHFRWIEDRTKVKGKENRNNPEYKQWRLSVYKRDEYLCKLKDNDCNGRIEAHHILGWSEYKDLRYNINNGITLCHYHHPRKRSEEIANINKFNNLINK